jgi:hypothetical protein
LGWNVHIEKAGIFCNGISAEEAEIKVHNLLNYTGEFAINEIDPENLAGFCFFAFSSAKAKRDSTMLC